MKNDSRYTLYAAFVISGLFLFRLYYIGATSYTLIADEAYFWEWSRHPDLSYYDMGPMVAWIIRFFTTLFPLSEFSVRLGSPVFSMLTAWVVFILASDITGSKRLGFFTIFLFSITPIATAGGIIMTYYTPQVFFMSLTALFLWRLVKDNDGRWGYALGISLGLGMLSHHQFAIFSLEVLLFVLLSKNHRKWLKRKELYIAIGIEVILTLPIIIWNLTHEGVMVKHAVGLLPSFTKAISTFFEYIGGQAGIQTPFFFLAVVYGLFVSYRKGVKEGDDRHLILFCLSAPMLLWVGVLSLGGRVEANWPISAYITGSISAVWAIDQLYRKGTPKKKRWITAAFYATLVLGTVSFLLISFPKTVHSVTGLALPPKKDPANRLYGWRTLGKAVSEENAKLNQPSFITARDYGIAAQLAFYVEGNPFIYAIPDGRRMSQYDFWNDHEKVIGKDGLFVSRKTIKKNTSALFDEVTLLKTITIRSEFDQSLRIRFYIYHGTHYKGPPEGKEQTEY